MEDQTAVWIVVAIVVLIVLAVAVALFLKRGREKKARRADEMRSHAVAQESEITEARVEAQRREAEAQIAQAEAEKAAARAEEARRAAVQGEALQEHTVRQADRIDPGVKHSSDDYTPQAPTSTSASSNSVPTQHDGPTHRA